MRGGCSPSGKHAWCSVCIESSLSAAACDFNAGFSSQRSAAVAESLMCSLRHGVFLSCCMCGL